ncbi:MAG TPA: DUF1559 domain-containing protein [Planctomycetaceae bacterium]|nr:DUF1559 domain-containing protein [Planctomycetaceae bacterium]
MLALAVVLTAWNGPRRAALLSQARSDLRQIGHAMQNYHYAYRMFPPGSIVDDQSAAQHGWEAMLLPQLDHADLYDQIDFSKPWDDPDNLRVFQTEVPEFIDGSYAERRDAGGLPVSHFGANPLALPPNRGLSFDDFTDGLSNTILAGNMAAGARGWGTPFNLRDPALGINTGPDSLGSPRPGGTLVLLGDGSVRFVRDDLPLENLKALATPNGGDQPVGY